MKTVQSQFKIEDIPVPRKGAGIIPTIVDTLRKLEIGQSIYIETSHTRYRDVALTVELCCNIGLEVKNEGKGIRIGRVA